MEPTFLLIESATRNCSAAISRGDTILSIREEKTDGFVHAEKLHLFIAELLDQQERFRQELSAVAVSAGPGSYTGLRIGLSLAKGLCFSLRVPLITISSLEVLFHSIPKTLKEDMNSWPMIDARRMEVYTGGFSADGRRISPDRPMILEDEVPHVKGLCFGDGADKAQKLLEAAGFAVKTGISPSARGLLSPALQAFAKRRLADTAYAEPFYLKDFKAGKAKRGI